MTTYSRLFDMTTFSRLIGSVALCAAIAAGIGGCATDGASTAQKVSDGKHSGFLGDYSQLSEQKDAAGETVLRYVNPKATGGKYQRVLLDPIQYYPAPQPTAQVQMKTLNDIRNFMDNALRKGFGARIPLATEPGPGVLRLRFAITAVGTEEAALKPYQYIPIAFLVTAATGRAEDAKIAVEIEAVDSMTGERMGAAVREGRGAQLKGKELTLADVQAQLAKWLDTGSAFLAQTLK